MTWRNKVGACFSFTSILSSLIVLPLVSFILLMWQFNRPPFDLAKLQHLQSGMTKQQVQQILGKPGDIDRDRLALFTSNGMTGRSRAFHQRKLRELRL